MRGSNLRAAGLLAALAWLPALHGAAWDTYDLHFYAGSAAGALAGAPGATAGAGWQAKRLYLAGEGSWYGLADRGRRRLAELTGVEGTSGGLFGVAAAGGTPVFERGRHQLVPVAIAGYNATRVRGCFREICRAVRLRTFDWGAGAVHVLRLREGRWRLRFGIRATKDLGLGFSVGVAVRRNRVRTVPCLQCQ